MVEELLKVSIIIPVHNAENTLNRCIESVVCQSYKNRLNRYIGDMLIYSTLMMSI